MKKIPKFRSAARALEYAKKHGKLDAHGENLISQNAYYSYDYAKNVIKGRFELGEKAISQDAEFSYLYARDVIKGRFELGEKAISQNSCYSYDYAKDVIKGKLPEDWHNKMIMWAMEDDEYAKKYLEFINTNKETTLSWINNLFINNIIRFNIF